MRKKQYDQPVPQEAPGYDPYYDQNYRQGYDQGYDQNYEPQYYDQYTQSGDADPGYGDYDQDMDYEEEPIKKRSHVGPILTGIVFYLLLGGAVFLFYNHCQESLKQVEQQLTVYEQAQPVHISQQEFEKLFAQPDWAALYDLAGVQPGVYEGKDQYAAYMQEKTAGKQLTCRQVSFDESQPLSYEVLLDEEKVAAFTMENHSTVLQEPDWQLGQVQVFFTPELSFRVSVPEGSEVKVNGVALDESHVIQASWTESLEDSKLRIPGAQVLEVRELLVTPQITVTDPAGQEAQVSYDEAEGLFSVPMPEAQAISETEKDLALDALRTYCKFMINKAGGQAGLQKYFLEGTSTYKAIVGSDLTWVQKEKAHGYADEKVTDYIRYSDNMFSVRASLTWQLTRPDDSVKESQVEQTMVFEKVGDRWLCTRMTGLQMTRPRVQVMLRFMEDDTVLESQMVDASASTVQCPLLSVPEGKTFAGWMTEQKAEDGSIYYQRVLIPDAEGKAEVSSTLLPLQPMVLYPIFQ